MNRYGIWPSKTHAVIDLSISAIIAAFVAVRLWKDHKEMKSWSAKALEIKNAPTIDLVK